MTTNYDVEMEFVGSFLDAARRNHESAWRALNLVKPDMIEDTDLRSRFRMYADRFALGDVIDDPGDNVDDVWDELHGKGFSTDGLVQFADRLRNIWRSQELHRLLETGLLESDKAIGSSNGKPRKIADRLSMRLMDLFAESGEEGRPQSYAAILDNELALMDKAEDPGIVLPYPRLNDACGPWMPGDVVALTAYSNGGKSTLAANLAVRWARRGFPVLAFPTEMRELWIARGLAAESGVSQKIVEKRQWKHADNDDRVAYAAAVELAKNWPLEVVNRSDISPVEIIAATRIIRKRWSGRPVIVIVDHVHRLRYDDDPNKLVGIATRQLRNFAAQDREGGLILVLLYQPRKPQSEVYRPIAAHEIRGDSTVWNEIDICISPFRAWVKIDETKTTPWGTPGTALDIHDRPKFAKPHAEGAKIADEHFFIKIDKQRVGGEGPLVCLSIDKPSGSIYETYGPHGGSPE